MTNGFHPKADEKLVKPAQSQKSAPAAAKPPEKKKAANPKTATKE